MNKSVKTEITDILYNARIIGGETRFIDIVRAVNSIFEVVEHFNSNSNSVYEIDGFVPTYDDSEEVEPICLRKLIDGSFVLALDNGDEYLLVAGH